MGSQTNPNSFLLALFGFEKAKSKAHILLIIFIHAAGWCLFFFLPLLLYPVRINDNRFATRELIDKSVLIVLFYLNYYFLIPKFFEKRKYLAYFSIVLLAFVVYFLQYVTIRSNYFPQPGGPFQFIQFSTQPSGAGTLKHRRAIFNDLKETGGMMLGIDSPKFSNPFEKEIRPVAGNSEKVISSFRLQEPLLFGIPKGIWLLTLNNAISSFALLLLMGGFIRLAFSFIRNQNEKKALENANLNAEVNSLRSQINPHFLFNTLNSIYSQAHNKSDNTEYSILKLSDLFRYVLYDSSGNKVDLAKDIQYISNYIDLQKIRLSSKVTIRYIVNGQLNGYQIAPLLLITFIENAFKHGISYTNASSVNIEINVFEETLTMIVTNPVVERNSFVPGGLGLKNVNRRLDLLYPGKHQLDIQQADGRHIVKLKLDLK